MSKIQYIKLFGLKRSCTNYVELLLRKNFKEHVLLHGNVMGWKHGKPVKEIDWTGHAWVEQYDPVVIETYMNSVSRKSLQKAFNDDNILYVICVKNPYAWYLSYCKAANINPFPLNTAICYNWNYNIEWIQEYIKHKYYYVIRFEDMLFNYSTVLQDIKHKFKLTPKYEVWKNVNNYVGSNLHIYDKLFNNEYYLNKEYLNEYITHSYEYLNQFNQLLSIDLMESLQYEFVGTPPIRAKINPLNRYSMMQKNQMNIQSRLMHKNHSEHDKNTEYWNILLKEITQSPENWSNKTALDVGCGWGRNIRNLYKITDWEFVDGVDISETNILNSKLYLSKLYNTGNKKYNLFVNNGVDLQTIDSNRYNFVMSTITFQHICVYEIRYNLLAEIYRVLKAGGLFSLQMGFGHKINSVSYYDNFYNATGTNSNMDTRIEKDEYIINDLKQIGFKSITTEFGNPHYDSHEKWIFIKAYK